MKKIFYLLIFSFIFLIGINKVDAADGNACLYYNEEYDVRFSTGIKRSCNNFGCFETKTVKLLDDLTINDTKKAGEVFESGLDGSVRFSEPFEGDCAKYLYYKSNKVLFIDTENAIYLTDESNFDKNYDAKFELIGDYDGRPSPSGQALENLFCTYQISDNSIITDDDGHPTFNHSISFNIEYDYVRKSGEYQVLADFEQIYKNKIVNYIASDNVKEKYNVIDHFDIRIFFQEKTLRYGCPPSIKVGYQSDGSFFDRNYTIEIGYKTMFNDYNNLNFWEKLGGYYSEEIIYNLASEASYIETSKIVKQEGNQCVYYVEGSDEDSSWDLALTRFEYAGKYDYVAGVNKTKNSKFNATIYYDLPEIQDFNEECDKIPEIYTDCLDATDTCKVSDEYFADSERLVPNALKNEKNITDAVSAMGQYTGFKYKELLCDLNERFQSLPSIKINNLKNVSQLEIYKPTGPEYESRDEDGDGVPNEKIYEYYNINDLKCDDWFVETEEYDCTDDECKNLEYDINNKIKEIVNYCNDIYGNYISRKNDTGYVGRMDECISFSRFYNSLVEYGIIDGKMGCDMFSDDFNQLLDKILDIIKIAGPILALGLGTIDFIKAMVSGDADKEMKTAFKRFSTRIIAAVLLFIIPFILAFLMDRFLGNVDGYDSDNPFCGLVEWGEE